MLRCDFFFHLLKRNRIEFFAGVPDSLLRHLCAYITDHAGPRKHIIAANEGGAVGLALGHYLATGSPGLVYMQNSGQGNAMNPLVSLADPEVYGVPMLLIIGWRGQPGHNDEPQHIKQGKITGALFETIGMPYAVLPHKEADAESALTELLSLSNSRKQPAALLVREGTFAPYESKQIIKSNYVLTREKAIRRVISSLENDAVVIATTGKTSRELYEYREENGADHAKDFLTVGGMGHASQIALGIALAKNKRTVCCIDGDGAALMHLGGFGIIAEQQPENFKHVLLNNGAHDSVGGQPTIGLQIDFRAIAQAMGYRKTFLASSEQEIEAILPGFMQESGPVLLEICVATGTRENLGRPKTTPAQNKTGFMEFLRD